MKKLLCILSLLSFSSFSLAVQAQTQTVSNLRSQETSQSIDTNKPEYTGIVKKIDDIAEQITVRIDNLSEDGNGSGVIIARQGNTYYVLTAKHVLCLTGKDSECVSNGENQIVTPDGKIHAIDPRTVKIPAEWLDLAVVSFESKETYQIATLGNYQLKDGWIFTSGFPDTDDGSKPQRILTGGKIFSEENANFFIKDSYSLSNGQELVYTNISYPGMSGGVILDFQGRLIGINNSSEGSVEITSREKFKSLNLGYTLGIYIKDFLDVLDKTIIKIQWLKLNTYNITFDSTEQEKINIINRFLFHQKLQEKPSEYADYITWVNYGNLLWRNNNSFQAIEAFKKAITLINDRDEAYYGLGLAYFDSLQGKEAVTTFEKLTQLQPNQPYYWRWLGRSYANLYPFDSKKALSAYNRAISLEENFLFYFERAEILTKLGKYSQGIDSYSKALSLKPHPNAYANRGELYNRLKEYDKALIDFARAISFNSKKAIYHNYRGYIYSVLGKYDKAIADFNMAISLNDRDVKVYANRGFIYSNLEEYLKKSKEIGDCSTISDALDESHTAWIDAVISNDGESGSYFVRTIAEKEWIENQKALDSCRLNFKINYELHYAYVSLGSIYFNRKEYDKALIHYNQAINVNPEFKITYIFRGNTYKQLRQHKKASLDYKQVLSIVPDCLFALNNLGYTAYEQQQLAKAIEYWEKSLQLDSQKNGIILVLNSFGSMSYEYHQKSQSSNLETEAITLALAVATYKKGGTEKAVEIATQVLSANKQWSNLDFLREQLWGDKLIEDAQLLFNDERLKQLID